MTAARSSPFAPLAAFACLALATASQAWEPGAAMAARVFAEAEAICARDGGALWGQTLCGPIFVVDYTDRGIIANQADAEGRLVPDGAVFRGTLPEGVIIANTPTEWSGVRWTQLVAPIAEDATERHVLLAHEMFHRIQPSLGLTRRAEGGNRHLDTFDGRYLLQLEWRALERALRATDPADRRAAVQDALAFRGERYRLFDRAAAEEAALEVNEGIPEYTGVRLGLETDAERVAFAIRDLSILLNAPTFVRSFAYATGPAYGLLLDEVDPAWLAKAGSGARFDELLAAGHSIESPNPGDIPARAARYDDGALRRAETARDEARRVRLAEFEARLIDGPVLVLPLARSNYQFNPQTLVPLEGRGMIYPTMRLTDRWGSLTVESGGTLIHDQPRQATVTAVGADAQAARGQGWTLTLNPGWTISAGSRAGDLQVTCAGEC